MSTIVFIDTRGAKLPKAAQEAVTYASQLEGGPVTAVTFGDAQGLESLGAQGASKVVVARGVSTVDGQQLTKLVCEVAAAEGATTIVCVSDATGKAVAPRVAARLKAGHVAGTIGLPQGWQVSGAYQGCVEAQSAVGYLALGCAEFAAVPGAYPDPRVFHHAYAEPAVMLRGWLASANSHMGARDIQVLESTPSPSSVPGGRAAYVLVDFTHTSSGRPLPFRGLVLLHVMPTDRQTYTLYKSMVLLHRDRFEALMPTMWESWKSWSVNPKVFRARMDAALASMRETSRIITGGHAERSRASDSTQRAFSQYIRGTATVEDVLTRERGEGDARAADRIVVADPTRYRIVPLP